MNELKTLQDFDCKVTEEGKRKLMDFDNIEEVEE